MLHGALTTADGTDVTLAVVQERVRRGTVSEVIVATTPDQMGDATAAALMAQLTLLPVRVTRLARVLPRGTGLEFAEPALLARALEGREGYRHGQPSP